ncbi:RNA polymerase-binding protein DksA [Comamonas sp. UBA7528]|uniref:RNA polymerase-binding protein DksA n=1 Tax=Comamonas sp. UBA7528 TaxID=1946391 RepID=UPI0032E4A688
MTAETSKKKATPKVAAPAVPKAAAVKTPVKAAANKVAAQPKAAAAPAVSSVRSPARSASTQPLAAASMAAKPTSTKAMPSTISVPTAAVLKRDPKLANNWKSKSAEELSDAEVIAMPDEEYMNDKQMAFFRHKLVQLKQDMHNNAGETAENLREDTVVVPDPADRATIEEEHALELRTRDRERKLLKKIEQSIARIDAGDYGYCDETGEPIGVGRLLARPTATLSLEAQQRRELKQKMFGD